MTAILIIPRIYVGDALRWNLCFCINALKKNRKVFYHLAWKETSIVIYFKSLSAFYPRSNFVKDRFFTLIFWSQVQSSRFQISCCNTWNGFTKSANRNLKRLGKAFYEITFPITWNFRRRCSLTVIRR